MVRYLRVHSEQSLHLKLRHQIYHCKDLHQCPHQLNQFLKEPCFCRSYYFVEKRLFSFLLFKLNIHYVQKVQVSDTTGDAIKYKRSTIKLFHKHVETSKSNEQIF